MPIFLVVVVAFCLVLIVGRWRRHAARNAFRASVEQYVRAREARIAEGAYPASIPTVEQWCAKNGVSHQLREIGWSSPLDPKSPATLSTYVSAAVSRPAEAERLSSKKLKPDDETEREVEHEAGDDDGYFEFVSAMFARLGIDLRGIVLERATYHGRAQSKLISLVESEAGRLYVNTIESDTRLSLAADSRHKWYRDGEPLDESAWLAVKNGAAPDQALRRERYAQSAEEAMSPAFDRAPGRGRRYVIRYMNAEGIVSWRTVSHVVRQADRFSAACHFRHGERRTFLNAGVLDVLDRETGEVMPLPRFLARAK